MAIFHYGQIWSNAGTAATIVGGRRSGLRPTLDFADAGLKSFLVEHPSCSVRRVSQLRFSISKHNGMRRRSASDHEYGCLRPSLSSVYLHRHQHTNTRILANTRLSGFMASWTRNSSGFSGRPWVLSTGVTLHSGLGHICGRLWLVAAICSVGAGIGLAAQQPWWNTVVAGAQVGAVFDVIVLIALYRRGKRVSALHCSRATMDFTGYSLLVFTAKPI
jgi:hypothetical protein